MKSRFEETILPSPNAWFSERGYYLKIFKSKKRSVLPAKEREAPPALLVVELVELSQVRFENQEFWCKSDAPWGAYQKAIDADDVYLRLESKENILSGFYATEAGEWERLGRFGNYFQFSKVGIGVTNLGAEETLVGLFDFFEISLP